MSTNAQHTRVCGIQSIQSSRLQQLQAGREPGHQQPGHGILWYHDSKTPKATR
ncbi:SMARCE1 isoform 5 [Pan troglodytes]|uniref:SWI/SNF related, matrix associated, actin dependent regulator of chromatin, subfamily e, member 1 n=3 Tax=Hominidae TaxID=9604 RepID=J3QS32_HUMAN|nr:SWI/SNF related, matrix associated, actin dependent regulator of chromatin, subfamily e, member 1 [Homo sapiens]PNI34134.1 SMARCE1 isoform 5 [Pan troglodytes]PNJ66743.1 SMARCE1 isoform 2 [Pongo abelii]KAI2582844.1 SWI/SNF related, matrix associated, actin dependent regulator of chromatin, subfamily e, member 1 [Homo sapiens]KAI4049333.1 SWI/SNF related, matrix associated, actin dependent regulator of chromatin, subfamily e, member 1 [Homo sapiens]